MPVASFLHVFWQGTREFDLMRGEVSERWVADTTESDDAPAGRIELITALVGQQVEL